MKEHIFSYFAILKWIFGFILCLINTISTCFNVLVKQVAFGVLFSILSWMWCQKLHLKALIMAQHVFFALVEIRGVFSQHRERTCIQFKIKLRAHYKIKHVKKHAYLTNDATIQLWTRKSRHFKLYWMKWDSTKKCMRWKLNMWIMNVCQSILLEYLRLAKMEFP